MDGVRPLDPRLLRYARSARAYLLVSVLLGAVTALLVVAQAWLLVEPHGKRALPDSVLTSFGADLARDYTSVGAFETAPGASGRRDIKQQHILKPLRSEQVAQAACLASRAESP